MTVSELIAETNYLIEQAESFLVNAEPLGEVAPHSIIGLWLRTADALEAMTKEMHARELHHFEEEQKSATLTAQLERVKALADWYMSRLPDGTGNGRAYNSHAVAQAIYSAIEKEA